MLARNSSNGYNVYCNVAGNSYIVCMCVYLTVRKAREQATRSMSTTKLGTNITTNPL